VTLKL